ncbi:MAG: signal peptidase I [Myxococcota bacterium]
MNVSSAIARIGNLEVRNARKVAKARVKDVDRLLKRAAGKVSDEVQRRLVEKRGAVRDALRGRDTGALKKASEALGELTDKHLGPYRKPAWRETFDSVGVAVLVALLLRAFVLEAFKIPSGSMIPTLSIGDQIFVNKMVYGIRIPFTSIRLIDFSEPKRGEVIVFICPCPDHVDFIKRVVALPGDTVEVRDSVVYINGDPLPRTGGESISYWDRTEDGRWYEARAVRYTERNGDIEYDVLLDEGADRSFDDFGPKVVPDGEVFVMGDNRDHSWDSRAWGGVPLSNVLGRSMFVWWSWGQSGLDTDRLGTWVD